MVPLNGVRVAEEDVCLVATPTVRPTVFICNGKLHSANWNRAAIVSSKHLRGNA